MGSLLLVLLFLAPALRTGWMSDDQYNANLPGYWAYNRQGVLEELAGEIRLWMLYQGRLNPLVHAWKDGWYFCVRDVRLHKALILALVLANLGLLYRLLRSLSLPRGGAALGALLTGLLVQFRLYHDPVLAFNGLMQLVTGLLLVSLLLVRRYATGGATGYLAASVAVYLVACLTYECMILLFLAHAAILLAALPTRRAVAACIPFAAVSAGHLGVTFLLRRGPAYLGANGPYALGLHITAVTRTLQHQLLATLPGIYGLRDPSRLFARGELVRMCLQSLWLGLLVFPCAWASGRDLLRRPLAAGTTSLLSVLGAMLLLLPAIPVAVCTKYQRELGMGLGYLSVYSQAFGLGMLALGALARVGEAAAARPAVRQGAVALAALLVAGGATLNYSSNRKVVQAVRPDSLLRPQIEHLIQRGLLERVPRDATLLADGFTWDSVPMTGSYFYTTHAAKRLRMVRSHDRVPGLEQELRTQCAAGRGQIVRLWHRETPSDAGCIILGRVHELDSIAPPRTTVRLERVAVRRRSLEGKPLKERPLELVATPAAIGAPPVVLRLSGLPRVELEPTWAVYEVPAEFPLVREKGLRVTPAQ
jgi:hypothetical protein